MTYRALETTLRHVLLEQWDAIPALAMIGQTPGAIYARTEALLARFPEIDAEILPGKSVIGGGATPDQSLDTWLLSPNAPNARDAERQLRAGDPPVIGRIEDERLVLDLRTVLPEEEDELAGQLVKLPRRD
jgi:L-seryl-tRNA(Ser) seleniumtransferase